MNAVGLCSFSVSGNVFEKEVIHEVDVFVFTGGRRFLLRADSSVLFLSTFCEQQ